MQVHYYIVHLRSSTVQVKALKVVVGASIPSYTSNLSVLAETGEKPKELVLHDFLNPFCVSLHC